jgi:hypothetical protein
VIEARVNQFERHAFDSEIIRDNIRSRAIGARAAAHPELAAIRIPDAIAGALLNHVAGQCLDRIEPCLRLERIGEHRFLGFSLRVTEARQKRLAVEHDGGVGGEDEVWQIGLGIDAFDGRALVEECRVQRSPFPVCRLTQIGALRSPALRIHPRIDAVADRVILRAAHQEARLRSRVGRLAPHQPPSGSPGYLLIRV